MGTITELGCVSVPTSEIAKVVDGGNFTIYHINGGIQMTVPKKSANSVPVDEDFELIKSVKYSDIVDIFHYEHRLYVLLKSGRVEIIHNISGEEINIISKKISGAAEILGEIGVGYFTTNMAKYNFSECKARICLSGEKNNYVIFKCLDRNIITCSGQNLSTEKLSEIMRDRNIYNYADIAIWFSCQNTKPNLFNG